ncbi:mandelate racemase/muconate lactonizing enzyme family protein [Caproiciproducens sp. NJN-50]|uniref:mandelate racemase/muconate lactonizing enzyme family protein n=1 Tax=Caproiciproducens sp. NJN-50 TaxID=2507162 RepID=UPI000FFE18C4|nr:mandelate racemase/muconate lactonizing enzyme family protein [Caproiciproducens sp. NJN-50]QAT48794.1 mandelate racemase/muconate lactonizing enzyme family protein [Caproiciproducens sp. NJN-50]
MKITKLTTYSVHANQFRNFNYLRIDTDEGIHGIGEFFCVGADQCIRDMTDYVSEWVLGQDPLDRERIQKRILNYSRFPGGSVLHTVASAIDLALWDIAGKIAGLPVYKMLGAVRDKVPVYCHAYGKNSKDALDKLMPRVEKYGYKACKNMVSSIGYFPTGQAENNLIEMFSGMRKKLGDNFEIGIDMLSKIYSPAEAKRCIKSIEPFRPFFVEEPIRPENMENWSEISGGSTVPIATGEQIFTIYDYERLLRLHAVDILQPDILLAGGFTGLRKIADLAEPSFRVLSPHNPLSPLANCINVHFCMCTYNTTFLENEPREEGMDAELCTEVLHVHDGFIQPTDKPGWGMDLNYDFLKTLEPIVWSRVDLSKPAAYTMSGAPHIM